MTQWPYLTLPYLTFGVDKTVDDTQCSGHQWHRVGIGFPTSRQAADSLGQATLWKDVNSFVSSNKTVVFRLPEWQ